MSRGLPLSEAMAHVGLKRRTFDSLIRPRVTPIRVGTSLIFDVHDLDRAFDTYLVPAVRARYQT